MLKNKFLKKKYKFLIILIIPVIFAFVFVSKAQEANYSDILKILNQTENIENTLNKETKKEEEKIILTEKDIVLYWETTNLVPPYYKGKILPNKNSYIKIKAIFLKDVNVKNLTFQWYLDDILKKWGKGKYFYRFSPDIIGGTYEIDMSVYNDNFRITKSIKIPIIDPEIYVYNLDNDKYLKTYLNNKEEYHLPPNKEINLIVEPYYFTGSSPKQLNYEWEFNKKIFKETSNKFNLKVEVKNLKEALAKRLKISIKSPFDFGPLSLKESETKEIKFLIY